MHFYCSECNKEYPLYGLTYQCECGGLFKLGKTAEEKVALNISLGEIKTPIIKRKINNLDINIKVDYLMPTGSFKDRGALVLINKLKELGIEEVVEDSSGNAAASIAAYCAAANIKCNIFVPESTSEGKIKQIKAYGANIIKVNGDRDTTAEETLKAAKNKYYASHVYNPLFYEGTKSIAKEIYEEIGIPDYVFVPVGNGTMLLGVYLGFLEIGKLPRIIGVQAKNCCPIYNEYHNIKISEKANTLAEGIAVGKPKRLNEIINAIKESDGNIITVSEDEIKISQNKLNTMGIYAEATSAAVIAGVAKYFNKETDYKPVVVAPLTGIGLKK